MPRGIDDDEAAALSLEIAPGDVDGDALLALGNEAVEQETEVDALAVDRAIVGGVQNGGALIVGDAGGIPQEPADQRGLAVVDRAAGEQPEHGLRFGIGTYGKLGRTCLLKRSQRH